MFLLYLNYHPFMLSLYDHNLHPILYVFITFSTTIRGFVFFFFNIVDIRKNGQQAFYNLGKKELTDLFLDQRIIFPPPPPQKSKIIPYF